MAKIEIRVDEQLATDFAKAYPGRGDRSTLLRGAVQSLVARRQGTGEENNSKLETSSKDLMQISPKGRQRSLRPDRTVVVSVRLTPEQYLGIEGKAFELGMETSPYVRALVDAHLERTPEWPKEHRRELSAAMSQLRKAGVNLNQLTFLIRSALKEGKPFPVAKDQLEKVLSSVNVLKRAFMGVLESRDGYWRMKDNRDE